MLLRFGIENFLSFKGKQIFSLLPGKSTLKAEHKSTSINGVSALKIAAVYGANASGKSNLIKAIDFGREKVLKGTGPEQLITSDFFKLDVGYNGKPVVIEYEFAHKGHNYAYGFKASSREVLSEWLYLLRKTSQTKVFERSNTIDFDLSYLLKKNKHKKQAQYIEFVSKSTPRNQLFLTQIINTNMNDHVSDISELHDALDWFRNALTVVYPGSKNVHKHFELNDNTDLKQVFLEMLDYFDTGIDGIEFEEVDFDKSDIPDTVKNELMQILLNDKSEKTSTFLANPNEDKYYIVSKGTNQLLTAKILKTIHKVSGGTSELFDLAHESDGTRRMMDLIPLVIDFYKGGNVFVVDEIERSLHPNLVKDLLDFILERCSNINSQLIFSTHEATLMTQKVLRKDEIWFSVKNEEGATQLHSLEDYTVRFDKELMKDYLLGRYKGVPRLGNRRNLSVLPKIQEDYA